MEMCRQNQFPYPDENIFFITGVKTDVEPIDYSKTTPLIVVSRKMDAAMAKYEDLGRLHKAKPIGCLTLSQLRIMHDRVEAALTDTSVEEIKGRMFGAILGKRQPWLIASMDEAGEPSVVDFVIARSSSDVLAHAKSKKLVAPAIYSLEMFAHMIDLCEDVKHGRAKNPIYAIDYKGGEFEEQLASVEENMTQDDKDYWEVEIQAALTAKECGLIR